LTEPGTALSIVPTCHLVALGGAVRRSRTQRRPSRGWWGVFFCACLAMSVYIAFDILDLDGSQMRDSFSGNAVAAEPERVETDRFLHHALVIPEAPGPIHLSPDLRFVSESPQISPGTIGGPVAPRRAAARPRADLRQETSSKNSPTNDPA
jgi:hypothetical protein